MAQVKRMNADNSDPSLNGINASNDNIRKKASVESGLRVMNQLSNQSSAKTALTKTIANNKTRLPTGAEMEAFQY